MMVSAVRFGEIYRLVDNGQPVTDVAKARHAFGKFQEKIKQAGYFYDETRSDNPQVLNTYFVTEPDKQPFLQKADRIMGLWMQAAFSGSQKVADLAEAEETALWDDTFQRSQAVEISSI